LRASVDAVVAAIPDAQPIAGLPWGLTLPEMSNLERHPLYLDGSIEVQDAGSQHVAALAAAQPGETVIDLCAGAGGKTLALAADMHGLGRLIACDTDRNRLGKLGPRASRAGADDLETRLLDPQREMEALAGLEGQADLVLIDAPCTGSGTWRRSPDLRWRMTPARAAQIVALQAHILGYAQALVKPGGRLVYAVCSVRDAEGATQVAALASKWRSITDAQIGRARGAGRLLTPFHDDTDGFFVAAFRKPC
jgi:16S rRNA (cytosine967-C5)-methyltransferase